MKDLKWLNFLLVIVGVLSQQEVRGVLLGALLEVQLGVLWVVLPEVLPEVH